MNFPIEGVDPPSRSAKQPSTQADSNNAAENRLGVERLSGYDPLRDYLKRQDFRELELSFAQIEEIIGRALPQSAERQQWWANQDSRGHSQREAWRAAGYDAFLVAGSRNVRFRRVTVRQP
jgi:hypothetical protein